MRLWSLCKFLLIFAACFLALVLILLEFERAFFSPISARRSARMINSLAFREDFLNPCLTGPAGIDMPTFTKALVMAAFSLPSALSRNWSALLLRFLRWRNDWFGILRLRASSLLSTASILLSILAIVARNFFRTGCATLALFMAFLINLSA